MTAAELRHVELDLTRGVAVAGDRSASAVELAAAELERALGPPAVGALRVVLTYRGGQGEGIRRRVAPGEVELIAGSPRGLLFGVYSMLGDLGLRWSWPGESSELAATGWLNHDEVADAPGLPGRCLVLGERVLLEHAEEWIVWAARNRLNSVFVHVSTRKFPIGAAPEELWQECRARVSELARARGMVIEHGGHLLPELLGSDALRTLAEGRPPCKDVRRTLEEYVFAHPEADVLHLWGSDLPPHLDSSPAASDAALRTANAVAAIAEDVRPGVQISFLAYHQTEEVPSAVLPRANVCLLFAPRERCYEHALSDPACPRNSRYYQLLGSHIEHFRGAGAPPARVFEYWFDAIRFPRGVPDLTAIMARDLAIYRQAGVHTVQMLMTGHGKTPAPHPNPPAFARFAWGPQPQVGTAGPSAPSAPRPGSRPAGR